MALFTLSSVRSVEVNEVADQLSILFLGCFFPAAGSNS